MLVKVNNLVKRYPVNSGIFSHKKKAVSAVEQVSFDIKKGETLGLVGESGCGKSTLGKALLNLIPVNTGEIFFNNIDILNLKSKEIKAHRKMMQMIFQDPYESLNPQHTVEEILEEPFIIHKIGDKRYRQNKVSELLDKVGLSKSVKDRFPFEFSGGQRQRVGIARAIALNPELIICDEAVSALDVSVQAQILNLLLDLQKEMNLTYLFISHDLSVVKHISDRIAVMYLGKIVEICESNQLYKNPFHPYTEMLQLAIPKPDPYKRREITVIKGEIPSPIDPPKGCRFHPRCPKVMDICKTLEPTLISKKDTNNRDRQIACHLYN